MSTVALIELGTGHAECLYSQVRFLREAGHQVVILIHHEQAGRVRDFGVPVEHLPIIELPVSGSGLLPTWRVAVAVRHALKKHAVTRVVFNTASGALFRNIALTMPARLPAYVVLHDVHRSMALRLSVSRMSGLLVLAERLAAPCQALMHVPTTSFYPAWFPPPGPAAATFSKAPGDIWLASIGQIETTRRSYGALLDAAAAGWPGTLRIFLLGNTIGADGAAVVQRLRASPMAGRIEISTSFVADADIHRLLPQCDGLLPLIDGHERYRSRAVSGAFNLAYGYHLPLILGAPGSPALPEIDDIALAPAPGTTLRDLLCALAADPAPLHDLRARMRADPQWSFATSQHRYLLGIGLSAMPLS